MAQDFVWYFVLKIFFANIILLKKNKCVKVLAHKIAKGLLGIMNKGSDEDLETK